MYKSIAENFYETGADRAIFVVAGGRRETAPYNLADLSNLEALSNYLKSRGSLGATTGERAFGDGLLTEFARHPANPLQLVDNANYVVTAADHFVVEYGTTDGVRSVWDKIIAPHLKSYGISTYTGVVSRTTGAPDGGVLEQPTPIGTAADPAMALVFQLKSVLLHLGEVWVNSAPFKESGYWKENVAPLLADPLAG